MEAAPDALEHVRSVMKVGAAVSAIAAFCATIVALVAGEAYPGLLFSLTAGFALLKVLSRVLPASLSIRGPLPRSLRLTLTRDRLVVQPHLGDAVTWPAAPTAVRLEDAGWCLHQGSQALPLGPGWTAEQAAWLDATLRTRQPSVPPPPGAFHGRDSKPALTVAWSVEHDGVLANADGSAALVRARRVRLLEQAWMLGSVAVVRLGMAGIAVPDVALLLALLGVFPRLDGTTWAGLRRWLRLGPGRIRVRAHDLRVERGGARLSTSIEAIRAVWLRPDHLEVALHEGRALRIAEGWPLEDRARLARHIDEARTRATPAVEVEAPPPALRALLHRRSP